MSLAEKIFPAVAIIMSIIIRFYIDERIWGIKELQIKYGVPRILYWLQNYIIDVMIILIVFLFQVCILYICEHSYTITPHILELYIILGLLYIMLVLPFVYFYHYLPGNIIAIISFTLSITLYGILFPLFEDKHGGLLWTTLDKIGDIIPFHLGSTVLLAFDDYAYSMYHYENVNGSCVPNPGESCCYIITEQCIYVNDFVKTEQNLLIHFVAVCLAYIVLFFIIEYGLLGVILDYISLVFLAMHCKKKVVADLDVQREKKSIKNGRNSYIFRVKNLKKLYLTPFRKPKYAVGSLYFGVNKNEIFGVFGKSDSGKSTICKILTCEISSSTGRASLFGTKQCFMFDRKYLNHLSYCPEHDAINYELTCRQMLMFICRLRGLKRGYIETHIRRWFTILDMVEYENVQSKRLTPGTKRKLSVAMALIGRPSLIILDMPTSHVDALCRRTIWSVLSACKNEGSSIVIFTNSFEECEALCDRVTILRKGKMQCLGTVPYLKEKYNLGFILKIYFYADEVETLEFNTNLLILRRDIEKKFTVQFVDQQRTSIDFLITRTSEILTVGALLQYMESIRDNHPIILDYSGKIADMEYIQAHSSKIR